jgi:two-component system cell cycle sensor histidine kinase/response regulator CckA
MKTGLHIFGAGAKGGIPPWRHPATWTTAAITLAGTAGLIHQLAPGLLWLSVMVLVLSVGALFGLAWALGWARGADPVADLTFAAAEADSQARLITTAAGALVYANAAFHRLFPAAADHPAPLDAIAQLLADPEDDAETLTRLLGGAANGVSDHAEVAMRVGPDGTEWRRIVAHPLGGIGKRRGLPPSHILWRARDVTAQRELDAIRRREEELLSDFLDYLPAGFLSADAEGFVLYANRTLADWLGVAGGGSALRGRRFADFVVETEAGTVGGTVPDMHGELTLRRRDHTVFPACLVQSERLEDDGTLAYSRSVVLRDVIWRSEGEGTRRELERQLHWLFDEAPVGIVLVDLHGVVTDCNRAFLRLIGRHREAVVGSTFAERLNKEDRGDVAAQLSKVVMGILRAAHLEVRLPAAREREVVASLYASRMANVDNEVSGLILHFIDTTEQKDLETQFAQSQKMQAVGQLAGGVAHDFNNLLTAMIGFSDLLLERHGPDDPSFADIMQIRQNANRATNLVRQLLAFSRKQTLEPVIMEPTEAITDLSHLLRRLIGENIELNIEHGRHLGLMRVDRGQFGQVIINLAVNARDAMARGGALSIRTSAVSVDVPVQRGHELMPPGEYLLIEVTDTGVGIAKENLDHIFEPFFSTKEVGAGTGLGLSTVYGIIHQSGGFIFVDSAPGEGTTFSIYLPRFSRPVETERAPDELVEARTPLPGEALTEVRADDEPVEIDLTGTGTVLLVEDEDAVRMFAARALRNKGYRVIEAGDGEAALDAINGFGQPIDMIVSDMVMPGMDGHTLVRLVRQELPEVKVILTSGYAEEVFTEEIDRDTAIHFLPKPFSLKDLAGKVKELMEA